MIHAVKSSDGAVTAFYDDAVKSIPPGAIPVTGAVHAALVADPDGLRLADDGTTFPTPAHVPDAAELAARLAELRYQREVGGITVSGIQIRTDRESAAMMASSLVAVANWPIEFKGQDGQFTPVDQATMQTLAAAVAAHVQAAFNAEKTVLADVDNQTITTLAELEAAWAATASI